MTVAEERYMTVVPGALRDIARSLKEMTERLAPKHVYVFCANQAWDGDTADTVIRVFGSEEDARKHLREFVHGAEGELDYAEKHGWTVELDEPDIFRAFKGETGTNDYPNNHTEAFITKEQIV